MPRAQINSQYWIDVECALVGQEIENNRSRYYGRVYHDKTSGSGYVTFSPTRFAVAAPGISIDSSKTYDFRNGVTRELVWEGYWWVTHDPDGTHPGFDFSASRWMANPPGGSATATHRVVPPTIPRATTATFRNGPAFDAGAAVVIDLPRASSSFTHGIEYFFGPENGTAVTDAGASATWNVPLRLLERIPDAVTGYGFIRTHTYNVGTRDTHFTLRAPASIVPTISGLSVSDDNPQVVSIVGKYVQGLSLLKATVNAAGIYGSTITGRSFSVGGVTAQSGGVIPLTRSGSVPITASATDTRGRVGTFAGTVDVLAYQPPAVPMCAVRRATSTGALSDSGTYLRVDLEAAIASLMNGTQRNAMTVKVFTRQKGASEWTARNVLNLGLSYASNFLISGGGIFDVDKSYDIRVEVADKFVGSAVQTVVATEKVLMHLSTGVAVGKLYEQGALDIGGDAYATGDMFVRGGKRVQAPGVIDMFAGATPPTGALLCNGQAVSRITYAALFAAIGISAGAGDGSTTFNVPDARGRAPFGFDSTQTEFDTLGKRSGAKTVALTEAHSPWKRSSAEATGYGLGTSGTFRDRVAVSDTGTGAPHPNLPPSFAVNFIIWT